MSLGLASKPTEPGAATEITDKYTVLHLLGRGGMGTVYEANHRVLKKHVAVKVLHEQYAAEPSLVRRFMREAAAVAALQSRYVVRVFDSDKTPDGTPFIVMELLSGRELGAMLRKQRPPVERLVDWIVQICSAMHEAHLRGIIHRDLKPSNIFIAEPDETVRVLDFGISRLVEGSELTGGSEVLGTPNYIAPEVLKGAPADGRSDLYAIGVIAYRALSGHFPCEEGEAANRFSSLIATLTVPARPIRELVPELPKALADAIMKALAKDPGARFSSAREMAMTVQPFGTSTAYFEELSESETVAPVRDPSSPPDAAEPTSSVDIHFDATALISSNSRTDVALPSGIAGAAATAPASRSRRWSRRLAMGSAALLLVVIVVAGAALRARPPPSATTTRATVPASELAPPAAPTIPTASASSSAAASAAEPSSPASTTSAARATRAKATAPVGSPASTSVTKRNDAPQRKPRPRENKPGEVLFLE